MNNKILVLFLALFVSSAFAQTSLKDNFEFHVTGPDNTTVKAGDSIRLHVKVEVKDWDLLRSHSIVFAQLYFDNSIAGSHSLNEGLEIIAVAKENGERVHKTDFDVEFKVPENFSGSYSLVLSDIYFMTEKCKKEYCFPRSESIGAELLSVEVLNNEYTDIEPPVLTAIEFSKTTVQAGDTFRIYLEASDKSPLHTGEDKVPNVSDYSKHIEFKNVADSGQSINQYPPVLRDANDRLYSDFTVPQETKAGVYKLDIFNLGDIWGNVIDKVAAQFEQEITVVSVDAAEDL